MKNYKPSASTNLSASGNSPFLIASNGQAGELGFPLFTPLIHGGVDMGSNLGATLNRRARAYFAPDFSYYQPRERDYHGRNTRRNSDNNADSLSDEKPAKVVKVPNYKPKTRARNDE